MSLIFETRPIPSPGPVIEVSNSSVLDELEHQPTSQIMPSGQISDEAFLMHSRAPDETIQNKRLWQIVGRTAMCLGLPVAATAQAMDFDQNYLAPLVWGNQQPAAVEIELDQIPANTDFLDTGIIVLPGTGMRSSQDAAESIAPAFNGPGNRLFFVDKGTAPTTDKINQSIIDSLEKNYLTTELVIYGISAGGKAALKLSNQLLDKWPDVDLTIILSSSPYDQNSAYQLQNTYLPKIINGLDKINLSGGPLTMSLIEIAVRSKYYAPSLKEFDFDRFVANLEIIRDRKLTPASDTTKGLLYDAMLTIDSNTNQLIMDIAAKSSGQLKLVYLKALKDTIVDTNLAEAQYKTSAKLSDHQLLAIDVNSAHAGEISKSKAYIKALKLAIGQASAADN